MRSDFVVFTYMAIAVAFGQDIVFQDEPAEEEQLLSRSGLLSLDTKLFRYPCYEVGQIPCRMKCQENGFRSHRCFRNRFCACANTGGLLSSFREALGSVVRADAYLYPCSNPQYVPCAQTCADNGYEHGSCSLLGSLCVCSQGEDAPKEDGNAPEQTAPVTAPTPSVPPVTDSQSCHNEQIQVVGVDCKENDDCSGICGEKGASFYFCNNSTFCVCATSQAAILSAPESPYSGRSVTYFTPNEPCTERCYGYCEDYKGIDRCLYTYCSHRYSKCVCVYSQYGEN